MSEVEQYINQLTEYLNPDLRPEFEASERNPLLEDFHRDLKLIETDNYYLIHETMHDRMFSTASLSKPKMETLLNYMHDTNEWFPWVYEQAIPNRENKAAIAFDITKTVTLHLVQKMICCINWLPKQLMSFVWLRNYQTERLIR